VDLVSPPEEAEQDRVFFLSILRLHTLKLASASESLKVAPLAPYETQWVVGRLVKSPSKGGSTASGCSLLRSACQQDAPSATPLLTHSLINQASLNFLESVYSSQHTRLIPNLGRFEFLAFGKALRAEWPVLLKRPFDPAKKAASDALRRPLEPQQAMPPSCKTPAPRPNRPRQTALTLRSLESSSAAS
jgi:hypothetical protein